MDFRVTDEQKQLMGGVRDFCARRIPAPRLRELEAPTLDRALWHDVAEMGVFQLRLGEAEGGLGRPNTDAVLVFAELGRALVPGPLVWTHLAAGRVAGAASGQAVVGGIDRSIEEPRGATPLVVEHLATLDVLVALYADRIEHIEPRALATRPITRPLDPLTPVGLLETIPAGERIGGAEEAQRMRLEGGALVAAQLLGIAEATLALAVDYAKVREQFGRAIGSFQAIKHILADMFVRLEVARAAVYAAGATLDAPEVGDAARAVRVAKIHASEAATLNARACIQVHGGMGYTWEVPAHYYLKRAWTLECAFGTREEHTRELAAPGRSSITDR